ncbi:hypothetical protein VTN49DRAFT_7596 [Thermomyces lanuginosus]|uniref:uncharacterized protein n=1 Tax=Thermomyces lanuginosus TaxID=5541 RepID=UPI00374399AC
MAFFARLLTLFGLVLLAHAGYSVHELSTLSSNAASATSSSPTSIPLDIKIETLTSVVLVSIGLVLGADKLKPVTWSAWAGEIEREGGAKSPYRGLQERPGFWNVRESRREFADWMRGQVPRRHWSTLRAVKGDPGARCYGQGNHSNTKVGMISSSK